MNHNFNLNFKQHHINPQHCHQITSSIDHDKGVKPAHHLTAGGSIAMALIVALAISVTSTYVTPQQWSSQTCPSQQVSREFEGSSKGKCTLPNACACKWCESHWIMDHVWDGIYSSVLKLPSKGVFLDFGPIKAAYRSKKYPPLPLNLCRCTSTQLLLLLVTMLQERKGRF